MVTLAHGSSPVLENRTHGSIAYKVVTPALVSPLKGALIGWKVRSELPHNGTTIATATPYTESTGPRDPGDAYRWVDARADAGEGIIIVPPAAWTGTEHDPVRALMDLTSGQMEIVATRSAAELAEHAAQGFVLYEPAQGWVGAGAGGGAVAASAGGWAWFVGGAVVGLGITLALLR